MELKAENTAFFDFVAKGTTQYYLQKLLDMHIKGFYFQRLEPEFMEGKQLDIRSFYSGEEYASSKLFQYYYILETILSSPYPTVQGFEEGGRPLYTDETRTKKEIVCMEMIQKGIIDYFTDYVYGLPLKQHKENKQLDEQFLSLIHTVKLMDTDFMELKVEDLFFGRMTDIKDVM